MFLFILLFLYFLFWGLDVKLFYIEKQNRRSRMSRVSKNVHVQVDNVFELYQKKWNKKYLDLFEYNGRRVEWRCQKDLKIDQRKMLRELIVEHGYVEMTERLERFFSTKNDWLVHHHFPLTVFLRHNERYEIDDSCKTKKGYDREGVRKIDILKNETFDAQAENEKESSRRARQNAVG